MKGTSWNKSRKEKQEEPQRAESTKKSKDPLRTTWYFWVFVGCIVLFGLAYMAYSYLESRYVISTGRIIHPAVQVRASTGGTITTVHVSEGTPVRENDLLLTLQNGVIQSELQQKKSAYEQSKQELQGLKNMELDPERNNRVTSSRRSVVQVTSRLDEKKLELKRLREQQEELNDKLERFEKLYLLEAVSRPEFLEVQSKYDDLTSRFKVTRSTFSSLKSELENVEQTVSQTKKSITHQKKKKKQKINEQQAVVKQKKHELEKIRRMREQLNIRAPRDGMIQQVMRGEQEHVSEHEPLLSITLQEEQWIQAYVPVQKYPALEHGEPARITVVGNRNLTLTGTVNLRRSARTDERSFTSLDQWKNSPLNLEYEVVPVRIDLKHPEKQLRPGMIVHVRISLETEFFNWF